MTNEVLLMHLQSKWTDRIERGTARFLHEALAELSRVYRLNQHSSGTLHVMMTMEKLEEK